MVMPIRNGTVSPIQIHNATNDEIWRDTAHRTTLLPQTNTQADITARILILTNAFPAADMPKAIAMFEQVMTSATCVIEK